MAVLGQHHRVGAAGAAFACGLLEQVELLDEARRVELGAGGCSVMRNVQRLGLEVARFNGDRFTTTQPWDVVAPRLRNFAEPSHFKF